MTAISIDVAKIVMNIISNISGIAAHASRLALAHHASCCHWRNICVLRAAFRFSRRTPRRASNATPASRVRRGVRLARTYRRRKRWRGVKRGENHHENHGEENMATPQRKKAATMSHVVSSLAVKRGCLPCVARSIIIVYVFVISNKRRGVD